MAPGLVCFDFDDTLLLTERAKAAHFIDIARQYHGEAGAALMATIGGNRFERFDRYAEAVADRSIPLVGSSVLEEPLTGKALVAQYSREIAEIIGHRCEEVRGAEAALEALRADGYMICLNSATPHEDLVLAVKTRGWERHFDGVFGTPHDVAVEKSKVTNLFKSMQEGGVPLAHVVMVGDGENDRLAAERVGCAFVGVRGQKAFKAEVAHLAEDMVEALELIRRLLGEGSKAKRICTRPENFVRVLQTDCTAGSGNALQAAVASVMGLTLAEVPNFITAPEGYEPALKSWLQSRGRRLLKIGLDSNGLLPAEAAVNVPHPVAGSLCVVRGTSPRGAHGHVVAGRIGVDGASMDLVHDPHPDGTMLQPPFVWCALFPLDD